MGYFSTSVFLIALFVLNSVMAFVFLSYIPTDNSRYQTHSIRYFQSYFVLASFGYLAYVPQPWISFELSILLTHFFLISSAYSVVLGIYWRFEVPKHFLTFPILLHIGLYSLVQMLLSVYLPDETLYRLILLYTNIPAVFLYALSLFSRFKSESSVSDKLLRLAVIFSVMNAVSIPVFFFATDNQMAFINIMLLSQNLVVFFLFGAIVFTALLDRFYCYKRDTSVEPLTGLYNRRFFVEQANRFIHAAERHDFPMSLIVCDIDRFAHINDDYGRFAADHALVAIAEVIKGATREEDLVAHLSQKEFVLLLPQTRLNGALLIAERMRAEVENLKLSYEKHVFNLSITLSVISIEKYSDINATLATVEKALKLAKQSSGNQVIQAI